jgi:glycosyltransferase involved in cell wall biosynthesis
MTRPALIAFNLAFIDPGPLTGPGYYARQLFENLILQIGPDQRAIAYVRPDCAHHFSDEACQYLRPIPNFASRFSRVLFEQFRLPLLTRKDRVDLMFSPAFVSPVWGARVKVLTIHDMYYKVMPTAVERFQRRYWQVGIPLSVRVVDHIITVSANTKHDLENAIPAARHKTTVVPLASRMRRDCDNGDVVTESFADPTFLIVANLTPNKNILTVVAALAQLRREGQPVHLIHVGHDHLGLLAEAVMAHDMSGHIESRGKVPDAELSRLYVSVDAVIVASLYEGFGLPAVEAQSMGAPLICSDRGALPEAAGDGAIFFNPDGPASLADAIRAFLAMDMACRKALVAKGTQNAATMSWERTAAETLSIFGRLLGTADA